ncbi:MAG: hypothetical protein ABWY01_00350 [Pseudoxanthomonas sp.]
MERFYYYVMASGPCWEVRSSGQFDLQLHETQQLACLAAATAARRKFAQSGILTGVRIQAVDHSWRQLDLLESGELREQPISI